MPQVTSKSILLTPSPYAKTLAEKLHPYSEVKHILPRRRLSFVVGTNRYCYLILKGQVSVHRQSDDRMFVTLKAPSISGISNLLPDTHSCYIKMITSCKIGIITLEKAQTVIQSENLWEPLAKYSMIVMKRLYVSNEQLTSSDAYQVICSQLRELMCEDEQFRESMSAEAYIRAKTHFSRSNIMRILCSLREGGYILIDRGKLVAVHHLPQKF